MATLLLVASVVIQLGAALLALRLIRVTRVSAAWILIAAAASLMAARRGIPLLRILFGDASHPPDLPAEAVALATSVLLLVGIAWIVPLFQDLKRSQQAVRASELRYRRLFHSAQDSTFVYPLEAGGVPGRFVEVNDAACSLYGYEAAEMLRLSMAELVAPESQNDSIDPLSELRETGRAIFETTHRTRSGGDVPVEVRSHLFDLNGQPMVLSVVRDVTERKRAEEALSERARLAALVAEVSSVLTEAAALAPTLQRCSDALVRHTGAAFVRIWTYEEAEHVLILRASAGMYTHTDGAHSRIRFGEWKIGVIAETREPHLTNEVERDPEIRDHDWARQEGIVSFAGYPLVREGRLAGVIGLFARHPLSETVLTAIASVSDEIAVGIEAKRSEAALRRSEERLGTLVERLPEGVILLDPLGRIALANPVAADLLPLLSRFGPGDVLTELGGEPLVSVLEEVRGRGWHEIGAGEPLPRFFLVSASELDDGRERRSCLLVIREVTRERRFQEQLRQQDRLASLGQLAAGIAHDFNNILQGIITSGELIIGHPGLPTGLASRGKAVVAQAERAAELIDQILDFSRRAKADRRPLRLDSFLREVSGWLADTLPKNVRLELAIAEGEHPVLADPAQIQQLVTNLALNARDAMPGGGELRLGLTPLEVGRGAQTPLPGMGPGRWVRLDVSDTGTGIPPEVRPHVFDPFMTTKQVGKGSGLGLPQVYGIVKQSGGFVGVESEVGRGTTFSVYLPALAEGGPASPQGRGEPSPRPS